MTYRILTLNNISAKGLARLPPARYQVGASVSAPDAILVPSAAAASRCSTPRAPTPTR
jgi:D-3-phosphoglycerate dehydrogenase